MSVCQQMFNAEFASNDHITLSSIKYANFELSGLSGNSLKIDGKVLTATTNKMCKLSKTIEIFISVAHSTMLWLSHLL